MKKHPLLTLSLLTLGLLLSVSSFGQVIINGVTDSTAVVDDQYNALVDVTGTGVSFSLTEAPAGMTIDASTGAITWTPSAITDGGKVTVLASTAGGNDSFSYNVYVANSTTCNSSLMAYYPFDEVTGTTYNEAIDPANVASEFPSTPLTHVPGKIGNGQMFDPTQIGDKGLSVTNTGQWTWPANRGVTFSAWINCAGLSANPNAVNQVIFSNFSNDAMGDLEKQVMIGLKYIGDEFRPSIKLRPDVPDADGTELVSGSAISLNQWVHVAWVYKWNTASASQLYIYINGVQSGYTEDWFSSLQDFNATDNYAIAFYNYVNYHDQFNGILDELAIFDVNLTSTQVNQLYQNGLNGIALCTPDNHAPLFTNELTGLANEGMAYTSTIQKNDIDGDIVSLSVVAKEDWMIVNTSTGEVTGTPGSADVGENSITLRITDGSAITEKTFTINVSNTNNDPVIDSDPVLEASEEILYEYELVFHDDDIAFGDEVTVTLNADNWLTLNTVTNTITGTPTQTMLGTLEYIDYPVEIIITDLAGATDTQTFTLRAWNVNDPFGILAQKTLATNGNTPITISLTEVFDVSHVADVDDIFPDDFTLTLLNGENYTWANGASAGEFIVTPNSGFRGNLSINANLSDGDYDEDITIAVTVNNSILEFTSDPITTAEVGVEYSYVATATDDDPDDDLIFTGDAVPEWANFNTSTQELRGTPETAGSYTVAITATDGTFPVTQSFQIVVTGSSIAVVEYNSSSLMVYPIPANDKIFVELSEATGMTASFELLYLGGNLILQQQVSTNTKANTIDISELNAGIYFYRVTENDNTYTGKVVVE